MKKRLVVISLGGSIIIPDEINIEFLKKFKKIVLKYTKNYKFIIVTGGGNLARKYIRGLKGFSQTAQSSAGIAATRSNAKFVSTFFDQNPLTPIPIKMNDVEDLYRKQDIVICGALAFKPEQTTDSTATEIAAEFKGIFINLTNVKGLYNKDPKKFKDAKFISQISWRDFHKIATKKSFKPGQHFVLDQASSKIILRNKVKSVILGKDLTNIDNFLSNKKFIGTVIFG